VKADLEPLPTIGETVAEREGELLQCCDRWLGKRSRQLASAIVRYLRTNDPS
jgi:hypothetical protein